MANNGESDFDIVRNLKIGVTKSQWGDSNQVADYCTARTVKSDSFLEALHEKTIKEAEETEMLGAPEVLQIGQNFIRLVGAKKVIDVGTYTGASATAWALALPEDGQVISLDITHKFLDVSRPLLETRPDVLKKIDFKLGSALDTLDSLIANGEAGKWDFAFVDADKANYPNYYERLVTLLRPKGVILFDNALWSGDVVKPITATGRAIDSANRKIEADERTDNFLINVADGLHVVFKK